MNIDWPFSVICNGVGSSISAGGGLCNKLAGWIWVGADGRMDGSRDAVNEGTGHGNKLRISRGQGQVREPFPGYQYRP